MGLETEKPLEFLNQAKQALLDQRALSESLREAREQEESATRALESARKELSERKERTLKNRSEEIKKTYERQIEQIDGALKKARSQRERAKNLGVKGRIETETEPVNEENQELWRRFKAVLRKDKAPFFCRTRLYYMLFQPSGFSEFLGLFFTFLLFFLLIPIGVYLLLPERRTLYLIAVYLLDILIFGGLYVLISNQPQGKHGEAIREGRGFLNEMRKNRKRIRNIARGSRSDSSEEPYHLEDYDSEIEKAEQEREQTIREMQSAQDTFEKVTKNIITGEMDSAAQAELDQLSDQLAESSRRRSELEKKEKLGEQELSLRYEQLLGKAHMKEEEIDRLYELIQSGEASSLIDAVTKLEGKG